MAKESGEKERLKKRRGAGVGQTNNPPLPSRFVTEQALGDIHRVMEGREFESVEDMNAFLQTLMGRGLEEALKNAPVPSPQQEAQELAYRAMEAPDRVQGLSLARQALAKDPDCVDALVSLAGASARSVEQLIAGLEKAVEAGERSLGAEFFQENKGHFWAILETRPYMRARHELADLLLDAGRVTEAVRHFEALIELNPNDNQGVRDTLLSCYLAADNLDGARRLLREYKEEDSALFNWGRTLERVLSGDFDGAARALKHARKNNRFVELYLTGRKKPPREMPESYSFGSQEEAIICLEALGEAWAIHPEALVWLFTQVEGPRGPNGLV
jgi:tetratricopeptide (TPR) repeat protein